MATKRDFYEILGVPKNASDEDIKKSYRKMAMKYHPDRNQGDATAEVKFKEAKEAYEMLSDAEKRAAYDQFGHAGVDPNMRGGPGGAAGFGGFGESFGDIFGDIFGQTRRQQGAGGKQVFRGNDLSYAMDVTLEEAAMGKESQIRIPSFEECTTCSGTGAKPGTSVKTCGTCQGQGVVQMRQGFFSVQQTCPHCRGSGKTITDPCTPCHGQGKVKKQKTLEIKIPAGIDDGMRIRSTGNGEPGMNGGPTGDLYVEIHIKQHAVFQRDGDDLHCEMPISFAKAALGGDIEVPTLSGKVSFGVPEGTQSGKTFRLRGKGIKGVRSGFAGDLFCHVVVETPIKLTDKQKELMQEFDKLTLAGGAKHSPQSKTWMDKVKEFFE